MPRLIGDKKVIYDILRLCLIDTVFAIEYGDASDHDPTGGFLPGVGWIIDEDWWRMRRERLLECAAYFEFDREKLMKSAKNAAYRERGKIRED